MSDIFGGIELRNIFLRKLASFVVSLVIIGIYLIFTFFNTKDIAKVLTQGDLDLYFKGTCSKEYKDVLVDDSSDEELKENYEEVINSEVDFFFYYFGLDENYKEENKEKLTEIFKTVYSKAKYEVKKTDKKKNPKEVTVEIEPMKIMLDMEDEYETLMDEMTKDVDENNVNKTDEELHTEFTQRFLEKFEEASMKDMQYDTPKTITIKVPKDKNDIYQVDEKDFSKAVGEIIPYKVQ